MIPTTHGTICPICQLAEMRLAAEAGKATKRAYGQPASRNKSEADEIAQRPREAARPQTIREKGTADDRKYEDARARPLSRHTDPRKLWLANARAKLEGNQIRARGAAPRNPQIPRQLQRSLASRHGGSKLEDKGCLGGSIGEVLTPPGQRSPGVFLHRLGLLLHRSQHFCA